MAFRLPLTKTSLIGTFTRNSDSPECILSRSAAGGSFSRGRFRGFSFGIFTSYCVIIFLISLADGVMSYTAPIFIENSLNSASKMGLIIAASSLAGLIFDFLFGELLSKKSYRFYLSAALVLAFLFPSMFLTLSPKVHFFILGMFTWGIYYELIRFSDFHFINTYTNKDEHAKSWGTLLIFKSLAYTLGPLIASLLISKYFSLSFISALSFVLLAFFLFLAFSRTHNKKEQNFENRPKKVSLIEELKIWKILFKKVWALWLFILVIFMLDAAFWTAGAVLSETLKQKSALGGFFLTVYMVPGLFMGLLAQKVSKPLGKKKIAFISGLFSGLILISVGFTHNVPLLLVLVFISSTLGALSVPEILATFEDYVARLQSFGNDMISLERTGENASYIIGPIIAGFLAQVLGFQKVFSVMGALLAITAAVALIFTPRKIPMPQKELSNFNRFS